MHALIDDKERNVIPRWRAFKDTTKLGELFSLSGKVNNIDGFQYDFFEQKVKDWQTHRTMFFATDLLSSALVLGRSDLISEAVRYIYENKEASPIAKETAAKVLKIENSGIPFTQNPREIIHKLKLRVSEDQDNALAWTDLARLYSGLGLLAKAKDAIDIAVMLAPNNRFVLRAAARFYIHDNSAERAHKLLRGASVTQYDPWVLSAEIATATSLGVTSRFIKSGVGLLEKYKEFPAHLTELAAAIGVVRLSSGDTRIAKKFFRLATEKPNENTLAQINWLERNKRCECNLDLKKHYLDTPKIFEANSWVYFAGSDWKKSLDESKKWLDDQPFSSRPVVHATYVAGSILEDHKTAIEIGESGRKANPTDFTILNNLTYSYAKKGEIEKAKKMFTKINIAELSDEQVVVWNATKGLLRYRQNAPEEGRALYLKAINQARGLNKPKLTALTALFLAMEEMTSAKTNLPISSQLAIKYSQNMDYPDVKVFLDRITKGKNT